MKVTVYTYKVIKGKFKDKVVKSFEFALLRHPACPISARDDEFEYILSCDELKLIDQKEIEIELPNGMTVEEAEEIKRRMTFG